MSSGPFSGLGFGNYTLMVEDVNGNMAEQSL